VTRHLSRAGSYEVTTARTGRPAATYPAPRPWSTGPSNDTPQGSVGRSVRPSPGAKTYLHCWTNRERLEVPFARVCFAGRATAREAHQLRVLARVAVGKTTQNPGASIGLWDNGCSDHPIPTPEWDGNSRVDDCRAFPPTVTTAVTIGLIYPTATRGWSSPVGATATSPWERSSSAIWPSDHRSADPIVVGQSCEIEGPLVFTGPPPTAGGDLRAPAPHPPQRRKGTLRVGVQEHEPVLSEPVDESACATRFTGWRATDPRHRAASARNRSR
jgi:hypothetical protein